MADDYIRDMAAWTKFILKGGTLEQAKAEGLVRTAEDEQWFRYLYHDVRSIIAAGGVVDVNSGDS